MEYGRIDLVYISMIISIFPFIIFILSSINVKVIPVSSILGEIASSLNDYPINDLSYSADCNEKYSGILYTFPGSHYGCSCIGHKYNTGSDSNNYGIDEVNPLSCSSYKYDRSNKCLDIGDIDEQKLYFWDTAKFCSKKYEIKESGLNGYLLLLNNSVLETEECEKGYKKCGKLDDIGNYLCVKENDDCPINDIKVTDSKQPDLENLNYSYFLINNKYFYYSNTSDKPVITKLKVAEEGKLCINKGYYFTKYPQYILDNKFEYYGCKYKINGELYEKDVEALDIRTKGQLYNDSNVKIDSIYSSSLYGFPFHSLQAEMTLYPKRYIGYNKKCLLENGISDFENFIFKEEKFNQINQIITNALYINNFIKWFSICALFIELFACGLFDIIEDEFQLKIWLWTLVNCLMYISMAVPIYINIYYIKKFINFPICGNDTMNLKINIFHSTQKTLKITTILSTILVNLQLLFNIAIVIIRYIIDKIESNEYSYNQPIKSKNYSSDIDYDRSNEVVNNDQNNN